MGAMERFTISMPVELADRLRAAVDDGEYASVDDIVREALADWTRQRDTEDWTPQDLRAAIQDGLESGPGIPAEQVFAELYAIVAEYEKRQTSA
jgi:antitoxin ParD1/3/4